MFDFLNENKRQILLHHPVLGRISPSQQAISSFIDNLSAFEPDLCSPSSENGQKPKEMIFTKDEIERLKIYARNMFSQDMIRLDKRIFAESGFEIFYHGGDRQDLNDWIDDPDGNRVYVRGIHNLPPNYHNEMLERGTAQGSGILVQNLYPSKIGTKELQIQIKKPPHAIVEELNPLIRFDRCYSYYEIFADSDPAFVDEGTYKINITIRRSSAKEYPNYLRTQLLCKELNYEKVRVNLGTRPTEIKVPHPFFGLIGIKKKKIEHIPQFQEKHILKNAKWMPLNNIITINDSNPAYLLQFFLPKVVKCDRSRLRVSGYPLVSVIISKNLLEEVVSFLLHNPDLYCDLVRGFLPKQLFPNINRGILNAPSLPTKGIIFDNFTNGSRIKVN